MTNIKSTSPLVRILDIGHSAKENLSQKQHTLKRGVRAEFVKHIDDFSAYLKKACESYCNAENLTYNKYNYIDEVSNEPNP